MLKKISMMISLLLVILVCGTLTMFVFAKKSFRNDLESYCKVGDVDDTEGIEAADARLILRFAVQLDQPTDRQRILADVDSDGEIASSDARLALRMSVGLEERVKHTPGAEATCTEAQLCTVCGEVLTSALGHDMVEHESQAATCTDAGWEAYQTCSRCGFSTYEEIPALGHDLVDHEARAATCTEVGWEAYQTCSRCGYTTLVEIPALGNDPEPYEGKEPTCTENGWYDYEICRRCGYSTYEEIPALGHQMQSEVQIEPNYCIRCGMTETEIEKGEDAALAEEVLAMIDVSYSDNDYEDSVTKDVFLPKTQDLLELTEEEEENPAEQSAAEQENPAEQPAAEQENPAEQPAAEQESPDEQPEEEPVVITWSSSAPDVISADGAVSRPEGENETVTLTVTVTCGNVSVSKDFTLRVIAQVNIKPEDVERLTTHQIEALNPDDEEFVIDVNDKGDQVEYISGTFSEVTVNSEESARLALCSVQDMIGIGSVEEDLDCIAANHDGYTLAYSFEQQYKGVPVYGRTVTVSANVETGKTVSLTSTVLSAGLLEGVSFDGVISPEEAAAIAGGTASGCTLIIYSLEEYGEAPVAAYEIQTADEIVIVDAHTGDVIERWSTIITSRSRLSRAASSGVAKTEAGEDVRIPATIVFVKRRNARIIKRFELRDIKRNITIHSETEPGINQLVTAPAGNIDNLFRNTSANNAMYNIVQVYDWYKTHLNRKSIDNKGMTVNVNVNVTVNPSNSSIKFLNNACWSTAYNTINFCSNGIGSVPDTTTPTYAACLDVAAHEYTHGVFYKVVGKILKHEKYTGAINEGYADIFSWFVDNRSTKCAEDRQTIRDIADPNSHGQPKKMSECNIEDEVHTNMSLVSYAAYLMYSYGIPMDKLEKLWYNSMSVGYDSNSTFHTVRRNVLQAAKNMDLSAEYMRVIRQAFDEEEIFDDSESGELRIVFRDGNGNTIDPLYLKKQNIQLELTPQSSKSRQKELNASSAEFSASGIKFNVLLGAYYLNVLAPGYVGQKWRVQINAKYVTLKITLVKDTGKGDLHITFENPIGRNLSRTVRLFQGGNVDPSTREPIQTIDCSAGYADASSLSPGCYTIEASCEGHITNTYNVIIQSNQVSNCSIYLLPSEEDMSEKTYRVVLTWGKNPSDLDAHILLDYIMMDEKSGNIYSGNRYDVYWGNRICQDDLGLFAYYNSGKDVSNGYGPETVTFTVTRSFGYWVNNYFQYYVDWPSGSGTWASSDAMVEVYCGNRKVATYFAPQEKHQNGSWKVFSIINGLYREDNCIDSRIFHEELSY